MKRFLALALVAVMCLTMLVACTSSGTPATPNTPAAPTTPNAPATPNTPAAPAGNPVKFTLGHNSPEDSVYGKGARKFSDLVNEYSGGNMTVDVHVSGALGPEEEMIDGIRISTLDFCVVNSAAIGKYVGDWNVFSLPYLFENDDHVMNTAMSEIGTNLVDKTQIGRAHV